MTNKQLFNKILKIINPLLFIEKFDIDISIINPSKENTNVTTYFIVSIRKGHIINDSYINLYINNENDLEKLTNEVNKVLSIIDNK